MKKRIVIVGAGPAGLTAAYELLNRSKDYEVIILEENNQVGGISKTINYKGNRMDLGGHRFFSKDKRVNDWWEKMLPTQGQLAKDDIILNRTSSLKKGGPNPEKEDRVMLRRNRLSRIFFKRKFFDYPVNLKYSTIKNMGLGTTIVVGFSYLKACLFKRKENSLEDFYINRFGKKLYSMFFENYTENLWGKHPREISPEWGAQRAKGLSIKAILKDIFSKLFKNKNRKVETSLIEEFSYPKYGPGELWEITAKEIESKKGKIIMNAEVIEIHKNKNNIDSITYLKDNKKISLKCDYLISSMPIKDLVKGMNNIPKEYRNIALNLPYRDYITIGVLLNKLNLKNETKIKTINNIIPDNWVYVHDKNVKMGRFQVYNNWSPYLVKDIDKTIWLGLEYFCNEGDEMWNMTSEEFANMGISEMIKLRFIDSKDDVLDYHIEKVKKAYPAYFGVYKEFAKLKEYLNTIDNLYCIGRNGQHRYNNIDHSMITSFETVNNIINNIKDKSNIWNVNTEKEYHEENK